MPKFNTSIDLQKSELRNAVIQNLSSAPASPLTGQIYLDTTGPALKVFYSGAWQSIASSTSLPAATTGSLGAIQLAGDLGGTGTVATGPVISTGAIGPLKLAPTTLNWNLPAVAAATVNVNIANPGTAVFDGITVSTGATFLLTAQTTGSQNGLWTFNGSASALTRPVWYQTGNLYNRGMHVYVSLGTSNGPGVWHVSSIPFTVDTDSTTWTATSNWVGALTVTTGGITVTGNSSVTGTLNMNSNRINNVTDPSSAQDAATKNYVDNTAQGLSPKPAARAATIGSETFTVASGSVTQITGTTVDGVSPAVGDRILVKDAPAATGTGSANSLQPGNGLYIVTNATTNLTIIRDSTMDDANDPPAGSYVFVEAGTVSSSAGYVVSAPSSSAAFTYGTNNIQWTQFSGAGQITAGTGLTKSGNTISIENSGVLLPSHGGTGVASPTAHGILVANGASAMTQKAPSATSGMPFVSQGSSSDPIFGALALGSTTVSGQLPIANGGTAGASASAARTNLGTGSLYTTTFTGDGSTTSFVVTPTPTPVLAGAWNVTTINQTSGAVEFCDVTINQGTNVITIAFTTAPINALVYSVVVVG